MGSQGFSLWLALVGAMQGKIRIPAGPLGSLKCDPPKGNGRRPQKICCSRAPQAVLQGASLDCSSETHCSAAWSRPCFTSLVHLSLISHHSRCDPALSVFASKCMGEYHAGTAALCDLGDPGWGIPGFRIELLLLLSPDVAHWFVFCLVLCCVLFWAILWMTHKMSSCMEFPLLVAILSLSFLAGFWFGCLFLVCLFFFGLFCL